MQSNLADTSPVDSEFFWEEPVGLFDPVLIPTGNGSKHISSVIEENASWLQAEPRTSLSILFNLFPGSIRRMSDALDMIVLVSGYLWDSGYTPRDTETSNPTWYWLEGIKA